MSRSVTAVIVLSLSALFVSPTRADDDHPVIAQVKPHVKDPKKPFTMLVMLNLKEGNGEKFATSFARCRKSTLKEKGCITYEANQDTKKPTSYVVYERWQNLAALEEHVKSEHVTALLKELGDLLEGPPEIRVLLPAAE